MDKTLEDKLAQVFDYLDRRSIGATGDDNVALMSYLDDPEVAGWLTRMRKEGRTQPNRFISNSRRL